MGKLKNGNQNMFLMPVLESLGNAKKYIYKIYILYSNNITMAHMPQLGIK